MNHQKLRYAIGRIVLLVCPLLLSGCLYLPQMLQEGVRAGVVAVGSMEFSDVKVALAPGITPEDLKNIKKVGLVFGSSGEQLTLETLGGGGLATTFSDNMAIEMLLLGFEVVEREQLARVLKEQEIQLGGLTSGEVVKAGKILAVDAIITGTVTAGQKTGSGFVSGVGGTRMKAVVTNATVKILNVETGFLMMAMGVTYKQGQSPDAASKALAQLLKDKLNSPTEDQNKATKS